MSNQTNEGVEIPEIRKETSANTSIGQHFLLDEKVIDTILASVPEMIKCVEIGAGPGTLTERLLNDGHPVISYEVDTRFKDDLKDVGSTGGLEVRWDSFLHVNATKLNSEKPFCLVGNIPYHISEPLMFLLPQLEFTSATLLVGKRLANSLQADINSPIWSRMSLLANAYYKVDLLEDVPREAFDPIPRADGALIQITPKTGTQVGAVELAFQSIVKADSKNTTVARALKSIEVDSSGNATTAKNQSLEKGRNKRERQMTQLALKREAIAYTRGYVADQVRPTAQRSTMLGLVSQSGISEAILSKPLSGISNQDLRILSRSIYSVVSKLKAKSRDRGRA